jgi:hypothetical protein
MNRQPHKARPRPQQAMPGRVWPVGVLGLLLAGIAAALPGANATGQPPRTVFVILPDSAPQPALALNARREADGTWTVMIDAPGFVFTDLCRTASEAMPIGHAHVILDGAKVATATAPIFRLGPLAPGRHRLRIGLRAQDHRALVGKGGLVEAGLTLVEPSPRG